MLKIRPLWKAARNPWRFSSPVGHAIGRSENVLLTPGCPEVDGEVVSMNFPRRLRARLGRKDELPS